MRKFLTAEWRDLIMANYEVDPSLLVARLPKGTELDLQEGRCFVSLVGFMFLNTRVLGMPVPFHVNFEEVNLRFYVTYNAADGVRRGVVFLKEIVPRFAIATIARVLYGEPYEAWWMSNLRDGKQVRYEWSRGDHRNSIAVRVGENLGAPAENSHGGFIIEHYWGYTRRSEVRTDQYKVEHPKWEVFSAEDPRIDVDFGKSYGDEFACLNGRKPHSVLLAKGSQIAVYKGARL